MKKGSVVVEWAEPPEWRRAAILYAKKNPEPKSWTRFLPYLFAFTVISAALAWDWSRSDREGLVSTVASVLAFALVYGALLAFYFLRTRFASTRVWIRENGIEMGELLGSREWADYRDIVGYFFDTDRVEGQSFRSLYWLPEGAQYPDSAVIPRGIDENTIRNLLASKGIEELELEDQS